jgi:hypothetical protein
VAKLFILVIFLSLKISATSINAEQITLTHSNSSEYGFSVKNQYKKSSKVCTEITINKHHKGRELYKVFLEVESSQGQPVFSSIIAVYPHENSDLVSYTFCYQSYDVVVVNTVSYGYKQNGLITAWLEITSELIAP